MYVLLCVLHLCVIKDDDDDDDNPTGAGPRGYRGGNPTTVQAWQPCPLWEPAPSHPIELL